MNTNTHYKCIDLIRKPKRVKGLIHRMVAEWFVPNPENKPVVEHTNEDKGYNRVDNLRWATNSDNQHTINSNRGNKTCGYKGIYAKTHRGKFAGWCVRIGVDNHLIVIGTYQDIDEAIKLRQDAVKLCVCKFAPNQTYNI